jgi:hypothetical protein
MATRLAATRDDLARAKEAYDLAQNAVVAKKAEFGNAQASLQQAQTELASLEQKIALAREELTERTGALRSAAKTTAKATEKAPAPERRKRVAARKKKSGD